MHGEAGVTETLAPGEPEMPVPCKGTVSGLPGELYPTVRFASRLLAAVGLKEIWTAQLAPAANAPPQFVVNGKSADVVIDVNVSVDEILLVSVTVCGVLDVETIWL
jgi:hypothetical protein